MDERKGVTVSYLRQLARKYLREGAGASRGRELVSSLAERIPALGRLARMAGLATSRRGSGGVGGEERKLDSGRAESRPAPGPASESVPLPPRESTAAPQARELSEEPITEPGGPKTRPAQVVTFPPRERSRREPEPEDEDTVSLARTPRPSSSPEGDEPPATPEPPHAAEPLVEGFFVTKMAGENEARRHHLLEEQSPRLPPADASPERNEHLGMLPLDYQDDALVLLARDPHTLFVFWDFSDASRSRALDDLPSPRAVLKVFDGEGVSREVDFALESRSYYLQGMEPGRTYRVEAYFVGADGRSRRIGHSSNRATLPPAGPSADTSIRFLRMPPPPVVDRLRAAAASASATARVPQVEEREYVTWRRVQLPGSAGVVDVPEVHRERTETYPDAPRVPGASDLRYAEEAYLRSEPRAPGASDQRYAEEAYEEAYFESAPRMPGASDLRYAEEVYFESAPRAPGASDQRHARVGEATLGEGAVLAPSRATSSSEARYLSVERAPGASDQRYGQSGPVAGSPYLEVPRAPGASEQRYGQTLLPGGVSEYRYLEVPRAPGASDQRYGAGAGGQGAPGGPGASDRQYLTVSRTAGASDQRYLSVPRAAGASDQRYLSVERAAGASEQRYWAVERASGASDQRYLSVERAAGASDQRYLSVERALSGSDQPRLGGSSAPFDAGSPEALRPQAPGAPPRGDVLEARDLPPSRPADRPPAHAVSPDSWRPAEPEPPQNPWAMSVARGPTASEQRALDKAREAAEVAGKSAPATAPAKVEPPAAPPLQAEAQATSSPAVSKADAPKAPPKPAEPKSPGSKSSSKSRSSRRGRK
ncbi:DUF4912 domain-containing protein [Corallococcus sp. EGB]|uniref:DUF4912 domain-containing protein n=1 Tax=Corallococcus sp. EGB TaxID=1521117 RepID=UPI001CBED784|nr:DUF4912 domain-containing protein [Corallococcus sp. EGB]